jgi:hypothetical protein
MRATRKGIKIEPAKVDNPATRETRLGKQQLSLRKTSGGGSPDRSFPSPSPIRSVSSFSVQVSTVSGATTVSVYLEGRTRQFIIDTRSRLCLIQPGTSRAGVNTTSIAPVGITGGELPLKGEQFIDLTIGGKVFRHRFGVCVLLTKADGLLGTDFLSTQSARLDLANLKLEVGNATQNYRCRVSNGGSAFAIFPARILQADRNASLPQERESTPPRDTRRALVDKIYREYSISPAG